MFLDRLRRRKDDGENKRIIDSLLPQREGKPGMRILSTIMPEGGLLPGRKKLDTTLKPTGVAESSPEPGDQENEYIYFLEKALEKAPCPGCKKLVESALVGGKVYQRMVETGKSAKDVKAEEIEEIKQQVRDKYGL